MDPIDISNALCEIRARCERGEHPVPNLAFPAYVSAIPQTVVELIIPNSTCDKLLLKRRVDDPWSGQWHTPGGFTRVGEGLHLACARHGNELGFQIKVNSDAGFGGMIGWREDLAHPYGLNGKGHLVHHYFLCLPLDPIVSADLNWFGREQFPDKFLHGHQLHMEAFFKYMRL